MGVLRVDLNGDVGEGTFLGHRPSPGAGDLHPDRDLLPSLTSASVACGFHAGDPSLMRATVALAREYNVAVGAHPSLQDREGFGRRELPVTPAEAEDLVMYQIGALAAIAAAEGLRLRHVKPHGALYNMAARDRPLADAVARATAALDPSLILYGLAGSQLLAAGREAGLQTASEVFADRAYRSDGSLVPRGTPGAVLDDPDTVVGRALRMVRERSVDAIDGARIQLEVDTICVHGDTHDAAVLARRIRTALEREGVILLPPGSRIPDPGSRDP